MDVCTGDDDNASAYHSIAASRLQPFVQRIAIMTYLLPLFLGIMHVHIEDGRIFYWKRFFIKVCIFLLAVYVIA